MKKNIILALMSAAILFATGCAANTNIEESDHESSTVNVSDTEEENSTVNDSVAEEENSAVNHSAAEEENSAVNHSAAEEENSTVNDSAAEEGNSTVNDSVIEEESRAEEPDAGSSAAVNPYFFYEDGRVVYSIDEVDFQEVPDTIELEIELIQEFDEGAVYHLHFEGCEVMDPRQRDRTDLGYFYVTPERIYYRVQPGDIENGADSIAEHALLMVQPESREDLLEPEEEGWHDSIVVDGNRVIYDGYVFISEGATTFYETYVWEAGKGLVEYVSGYGPGTHEVIYTWAE